MGNDSNQNSKKKIHVNLGDGDDMRDSNGHRHSIVFNKRAILVETKTAYRSIAYDLVQFLIRYRYENANR